MFPTSRIAASRGLRPALICNGHSSSAGLSTANASARRLPLAAHVGGASRFISHAPGQYHMKSLRARQPKELLQTDVFRSIPPEDLVPKTLQNLARRRVMSDPAKILKIYRRHSVNCDRPDPPVVIRAFVQLGFLFDPNSFFATADRQKLTGHRYFKMLAHDLAQVRREIPDAAAPLLLYALSCLEYRCAPLLPTLLDKIEANLAYWRTEILSLTIHSVAALGIVSDSKNAEPPLAFDLETGGHSRDYGQLCALLAQELGRRASLTNSDGEETASLQDWSRAAFAISMAGLYDIQSACGSGPALPAIVARACEDVRGQDDLYSSGWAQFFLYQTLYCTDVERPASEFAIKQAVPMWIQEKLHERWLDNIVLHAQPQGADDLQRDVGSSLRRTNTQALLNCSAGREWDEQHCWFAGFLLEPKIAIECDAMLPLSPGRPKSSGWLSMKSRLLRKMGYTVVTIHRCFWDGLTEDQKDEQILRLRTQVGYVHDKELEKRERRVRQTPHVYKGLESKRKEWTPEPTPTSL